MEKDIEDEMTYQPVPVWIPREVAAHEDGEVNLSVTTDWESRSSAVGPECDGDGHWSVEGRRESKIAEHAGRLEKRLRGRLTRAGCRCPALGLIRERVYLEYGRDGI